MYAPNKILVLSEFHQQIIKSNHAILDDSIFHITRNAVNQKAVEYADQNAGERNKFKLIYASSYDRGLDHVLEMWPVIRAAVPEATLDIYYGWHGFDRVMQARMQTARNHALQMQQYKTDIIRKIANSKGVRELGRVSQNELYQKFSEASIWLYPTEFEEISCITAMQAQALGTIPICTPYAALNETVHSRFGYKVDRQKIADCTIDLLKRMKDEKERKKITNTREEMKEWAREKFDVSSLAREWDIFFNEN
jgi:glycosyltransferase involved in cell wall biosynthesis